jgi:hypothetical protein
VKWVSVKSHLCLETEPAETERCKPFIPEIRYIQKGQRVFCCGDCELIAHSRKCQDEITRLSCLGTRNRELCVAAQVSERPKQDEFA